MEIIFDFMWIPKNLGGHNSEPYEGMKTTIRLQRHLRDFMSCSRDVQWKSIEFDSNNNLGRATCTFVTDDLLPEPWLSLEGELIELLSGYRVLSVGRIISAGTSVDSYN